MQSNEETEFEHCSWEASLARAGGEGGRSKVRCRPTTNLQLRLPSCPHALLLVHNGCAPLCTECGGGWGTDPRTGDGGAWGGGWGTDPRMSNALLVVYNALLVVHNALLVVYNALLVVHNALLVVYNALLVVYNALLVVHNALLVVYNALLVVHNALLVVHKCCAPLCTGCTMASSSMDASAGEEKIEERENK